MFSIHSVRASNPKLKFVIGEATIPYKTSEGPNFPEVGFTHTRIPSHV